MVDHLTSERHGAAAPQGPDSEGHSLVPQVPLYDVILRRRDVRGEFCGEPVDPAVLRRVLSAAHAAPSVGLTQPWDFVVVTDPETRRAFHAHVQAERDRFAPR